MAEEAHNQAQREFAGRLLAPEHVLSHHIHRVVDRLLQANNLGKLIPLNDAHGSGATIRPLVSHFAVDVHDSSSASEEDWELLIVNDNRVPNARATYRESHLGSHVTALDSLCAHRDDCCFHRNPWHSEG